MRDGTRKVALEEQDQAQRERQAGTSSEEEPVNEFVF